MNYGSNMYANKAEEACQTQATGVAGAMGGSVLGDCTSNRVKSRGIGFTFGDALDRVKRGYRMTRGGWNGPGQFIYIIEGSDPSRPDERASHLSGVRSDLFAFGDKGTVRRLPHVALSNTRGESVPWFPSMTDMLAEDWVTL